MGRVCRRKGLNTKELAQPRTRRAGAGPPSGPFRAHSKAGPDSTRPYSQHTPRHLLPKGRGERAGAGRSRHARRRSLPEGWERVSGRGVPDTPRGALLSADLNRATVCGCGCGCSCDGMGAPSLPRVWQLYLKDHRVSTFKNWPFLEGCACTPERVRPPASSPTPQAGRAGSPAWPPCPLRAWVPGSGPPRPRRSPRPGPALERSGCSPYLPRALYPSRPPVFSQLPVRTHGDWVWGPDPPHLFTNCGVPCRWPRPASSTALLRTSPIWRSVSSASRNWKAGSQMTTPCKSLQMPVFPVPRFCQEAFGLNWAGKKTIGISKMLIAGGMAFFIL